MQGASTHQAFNYDGELKYKVMKKSSPLPTLPINWAKMSSSLVLIDSRLCLSWFRSGRAQEVKCEMIARLISRFCLFNRTDTSINLIVTPKDKNLHFLQRWIVWFQQFQLSLELRIHCFRKLTPLLFTPPANIYLELSVIGAIKDKLHCLCGM